MASGFDRLSNINEPTRKCVPAREWIIFPTNKEHAVLRIECHAIGHERGSCWKAHDSQFVQNGAKHVSLVARVSALRLFNFLRV